MKRAYWFVLLFLLVFYSTHVLYGIVAKPTGNDKTDKQNNTIKDHSEKLKKHYGKIVNILCQISEIYFYEARLNDAVKLLNSDILNLIYKELSPEDRIRLHTKRGKILINKSWIEYSNLDESFKELFEAERIAKEINNRALLADVFNQLGIGMYSKTIFFDSSLMDTALQNLKDALEIRLDINDKRGIAESLFRIGCVYQNKKGATEEDIAKAFHYFQKAYNLADAGNFKLEKSYAARHLSYLYDVKNGDLDKSLYYAKVSLDLREEIGLKIFLPSQYLSVGVIYLLKKDVEQALEYLQIAYDRAAEINYKRTVISSLIYLGDAYLIKTGKEDAMKHYQKALGIAQSIKFKPGIDRATTRIKKISH